jgi:hypothetical protein
MHRWPLVLLLAAPLPMSAGAESPPDRSADVAADEGTGATGGAGAARGAGRPSLSLDSILKPRQENWEAKPTLRGGRDRETWRRDFENARTEVTQLDGQVDALQEKLRAASSGEWSYSPAGAGEASDPEVLKLRARLKRDRSSLETAHARLRDLEVEASLAEVPDHWIEPPAE